MAKLEQRSLDIDFINEEQLKTLLQPESEQQIEPIEVPQEEEEVVEVQPEEPEPEVAEEEDEPEPEEEKPVEEEEPVEEEADSVDDTLEEDQIADQTGIPEEELFQPPSQTIETPDGISEIEGIESAIPVEKIDREQVRKNFQSILKTSKLNLTNRNKSVQKKAQEKEIERTSKERTDKVQTIIAGNTELFKEKRIDAKWKQFPLSRLMRRQYDIEVDKVIQANWKLPLELDPGLEAKVRVVVSKSGKILDFEIVESSRNRFFNHTVLQLFKNLVQLPPLPEDFTGESTEIGLRFTSNQTKSE